MTASSAGTRSAGNTMSLEVGSHDQPTPGSPLTVTTSVSGTGTASSGNDDNNVTVPRMSSTNLPQSVSQMSRSTPPVAAIASWYWPPSTAHPPCPTTPLTMMSGATTCMSNRCLSQVIGDWSGSSEISTASTGTLGRPNPSLHSPGPVFVRAFAVTTSPASYQMPPAPLTAEANTSSGSTVEGVMMLA